MHNVMTVSSVLHRQILNCGGILWFLVRGRCHVFNLKRGGMTVVVFNRSRRNICVIHKMVRFARFIYAGSILVLFVMQCRASEQDDVMDIAYCLEHKLSTVECKIGSGLHKVSRMGIIACQKVALQNALFLCYDAVDQISALCIGLAYSEAGP
jgi:hypothetical protein